MFAGTTRTTQQQDLSIEVSPCCVVTFWMGKSSLEYRKHATWDALYIKRNECIYERYHRTGYTSSSSFPLRTSNSGGNGYCVLLVCWCHYSPLLQEPWNEHGRNPRYTFRIKCFICFVRNIHSILFEWFFDILSWNDGCSVCVRTVGAVLSPPPTNALQALVWNVGERVSFVGIYDFTTVPYIVRDSDIVICHNHVWDEITFILFLFLRYSFTGCVMHVSSFVLRLCSTILYQQTWKWLRICWNCRQCI